MEGAQRHFSTTHRLNNLPAQVTSFIGRQTEIKIALERLAQPEVRLLTLTGPGGVGKTRLALQLANRKQESFEDGVFFLSLASFASAWTNGQNLSLERAVAEALEVAVSHQVYPAKRNPN